MKSIHSTAIVNSKSNLHSSVKIGPYSIIGPDVTLGEGCNLHHHVTIMGPTTIGKENEFFPYSSIGEKSQDLKYQHEPTFLEIGDKNIFREGVTVNRATSPGATTKIGNHGVFLAFSHIAHDCIVGDHVIFSNNATLAGHVIVNHHAIIGGLSGVHQFCRIGEYSLIGGCTKVVQDVPPFLIADGNPATIRGVNIIGLKRNGFNVNIISDLRYAYKLLYHSQYNTTQAIDLLKDQYADSEAIESLITFILNSNRGIIC